MSVITPFNIDRNIGSFFGADQSEEMNKSVVGVIFGSSFDMAQL
jgi:hypothetical protein